MSNRYNFASTAGTIVDDLHNAMAARELQRQKQVEEARLAEELRLRQEQEKRAAAQAKSQEETAALNRTVATDTMTRNQRNDVEGRLTDVGMGGEVSGDLLEQAKKLSPESLKVTQSHTQNTLPAFSVDPNSGARTQVSAETPFTVADKTTFAGSRAERTNQELATKMGGAKSRQEAVQIALGAGVPANQVDDVVNTLFKSQKTLLYRTKSGALAYDAEGKQPYTEKQLPVDYQIVNDPTAAGANGGAPFIMAIPTAEGTRIVNGRDTSLAGQTFSLRPSAAQQQDMVNNASAMTQIALIKDSFDPAWTGPAAGRIGSIYTALANDAPGLARMQTRVAALKDRFIKAITGAQMSEPEATRIMKELPDMNLPPTTFMERLAVAEQNIGTLMELQQQVYTGQRKPSGDAITETQLNKLFPNNDLAKIGDKTPTTPTPAGATPPKSKYHVTVG